MDHDENPLARALRLASGDPAARPDFYRQLLESEVYVLGPPDDGDGERRVVPGESIAIQHWTRRDGSPVLPFFTSLEALQRAIDEQCTYFALSARALLEMTRGASLVLDPRSEFGKEFVPAEVESLLAGGFGQAVQRREYAEAAQVLLGQPKQRPVALLEGLAAFLAKRPTVRAAYLALMHEPAVDPDAHLIVGIELDGEPGPLLAEIGSVAGDLAPPGEAVDLVRVERGAGGISDYFLENVEPFYRRA